MLDIVTIWHNETNHRQMLHMAESLEKHEPGQYNLIVRDNSQENLGFAKGCNWGAKLGNAPIIGFVNPDITVHGPFIQAVEDTFQADPKAVIVGSAFGTKPISYRRVGLRSWVCGAFFFVRRDWFESVGGFHEAYVWSWEETDLCRQAQQQKRKIVAIDALLPITHDGTPPGVQSEEDTAYKTKYFAEGKKIYNARWRRG